MHLKHCGLQKTTLVDYPGEVAATLFTLGCNLRCPFCHNPELVIPGEDTDFMPLDDIFTFLNKRKNVLSGVCITGGEPLLNENIEEVIQYIKNLGLKIKIDTNGTLPNMLKRIKPDYVAMDIKTSLHRYNELTLGKSNVIEKVRESIDFLLHSDIRYEFRTTFAPFFVEIEDLKNILKTLQGAKAYSLNAYRDDVLLDSNFRKYSPHLEEAWQRAEDLLKASGIPFKLRRY